MSRICQGCGGVLGRDCYNEQDCEQGLPSGTALT